jgi:hypothetical protein
MKEPKPLILTEELKEIQSRLSQPDSDDLFYIEKDSLLLLLSGKDTKLHRPVEEFFSPVFLRDGQEKILYPLFFLASKVQRDGDTIYFTRTPELAIPNHLATDILKSFGVDIDLLSATDLDSYLFSLSSALDFKKLSPRLSLVNALSFYTKDTLMANLDYPYVSANLKGESLDKKYDGFMKNVHNPSIEMSLTSGLEKTFFLPFVRADRTLASYSSLRVLTGDDTLRQTYLIRALSRAIAQGKTTILLVATNEDKFKLKLFFKERHLSPFVCDAASFHPYQLTKETISPSQVILPEGLLAADVAYRQAEQSYLCLAHQKRMLFHQSFLSVELVNLAYEAKEEGKTSYPLDISGYSQSDFAKDQVFLDSLAKYPTVLAKPLTENPFFGLTLSSKRENYDSLEVTLIQALEGIRLFQKTLKDNALLTLKGEEITCFGQFVELGKDMDVLAGDTGYPLEAFRNGPEVTKDLDLNTLRQLYQSVSSTKLLADNLCTDKIYQIALPQVLEDYHSKHLFDRLWAKHILKSCLKIKKHADLETVVRILESYLLAVTTLKQERPKYVSRFGKSVMTMEGLSESQAQAKYLQRFRMRGQMNPSFRLSNPLILKAIQDESFRKQLLHAYDVCEKDYQALNVVLNHYIGCFLDVRKNYLSVPFKAFLEEISLKAEASYPEFQEYADFASGLNSSSLMVQLAVRKYQEARKDLGDFRMTFVLSLYEAIYNEAKSGFAKDMDTYNAAKKLVNDNLPKARDYQDSLREVFLSQSVSRHVIDHDYLDKLYTLLHQLSLGNYGASQRSTALALYAKAYPILIAIPQEVSLVSSYLFDNAILLDTLELDNLSLLAGVSAARNVTFINSISDTDSRIQGYPEVAMTLESLYLASLTPVPLAPAFQKALVQASLKAGYEVVSDSPLFPLGLRKPGEKTLSFALVPDSYVREDNWQQALGGLSEFLMSNYHVRLVPFLGMETLFEKDKLLSSLTTD